MDSANNLPTDLADRAVYIIGPIRLQNRLLARFLTQETGVVCSDGDTIESVFNPGPPKHSLPGLILWDCLDIAIDDFLGEIKPHHDSVFEGHYLAAFNMSAETKDADRALEHGVRGFFYEHDPPEQILKGIRAIFSNELWVSREILTKVILENRGREDTHKAEASLLTAREIEILTLIAAGTKNEEIAEQLYISPHTVRTHIYNIYKKINVPNRLQAALWAVQNL